MTGDGSTLNGAGRPRFGSFAPRLAAQADLSRLTRGLREPVTQRIALGVLAVLAVLFTLDIAETVAVPLFFAFFLSIVLRPIVRFLCRLGLPRRIASAGLVVLLLVGLAAVLMGLQGPVGALIDRAPELTQTFNREFFAVKQVVEDTQRTVRQVEDAAATNEQPAAPIVTVQQGPTLLETAVGAVLATLITIVVIFVLTYFILAESDSSLLPGLLAVFGASPGRILTALSEIERDVGVYLLTISLINFALGGLTFLVMLVFGVPNPIRLGVIAFAVAFIAYVGRWIGTVLIFAIALLSAPDASAALNSVLVPVGIYVVMTLIEGEFVTPAIVGRRLVISPVVVFVSILVWGFMWGIAGAFLAVPILIVASVLVSHLGAEPLAAAPPVGPTDAVPEAAVAGEAGGGGSGLVLPGGETLAAGEAPAPEAPRLLDSDGRPSGS